MPNLDRFPSADTGGERELTYAEDFWAAKEEAARRDAIKRVMDAIAAAQAITAAEHRSNGLNLCDVLDYLNYAMEAMKSEVE